MHDGRRTRAACAARVRRVRRALLVLSLPTHLPAVTIERVRAGVMAGVLAAAATAGAELTMAWRAGSALRPFVESGRAVLGPVPLVTAGVLGLGLHVAISVGWGLLLAAAAYGRRGLELVTASVLVALLALVVHSALLPPFRLGYGLGVFPLHGAPLVFLYVLFAAGLAGGMRLAR